MGIAPVAAIPKVLSMTGLSKDDVDVWEVRTLDLLHTLLCSQLLMVDQRGIRLPICLLH